MEKKGIILAGFGKRGYLEMAHNMAFSLKRFNPDLHITLLHDDNIRYVDNRSWVFDNTIEIPDELMFNDYRRDPAKVKCHLYDLTPYEHTLYLDVDGLALHDVTPYLEQFIEKPGFYYTNVVGKGKKDDKIEYSIWASNDVIWDFFELGDDQEAVSIQSSYAYFQKSKEADIFFEDVKHNYFNFDTDDLTIAWGGTLPDELIYSGTIAKHQIDADGGNFIFFGNKVSKLSYTELGEKYAILSLYGNGNGRKLVRLKYWEHYDRLMHKYCRDFGREKGVDYPHIYKSFQLGNSKHVNR